MAYPVFQGTTLDDVMRSVVEALLTYGQPINPTKGPAVELTGVLLEISNPRARLSRTETRGRLFSCLGEFCWYLAKSDALGFISYYLPRYKNFADKGIIFGAYGPRLFNWRGIDQVANVISLLREKPDSRQAVIQLFDAKDILGEHSDIPCTCTLQFMIRNERLHMFTSMRSNDTYLGLPHDIFSFTMLQEIVARDLSIELGSYKHAAGSIHLYDTNRKAAQRFHDEGWQSTETPMPPMPVGDPWPAIHDLLKAELAIRTEKNLDAGIFDEVDPYWGDLIRLLQVFRFKKEKDADKVRKLREKMSSNVYSSFIDKVLSKIE